MITYGYSGVPPANMPDEEFLDGLVEQGYQAFELAFTKSFPWNKRRCAAFGETAAGRGIPLSVHAPYFAVLTVTDEDRARRCRGAIEHAMNLAAEMDARVVVAHLGGRRKQEPGFLMDTMREHLDHLATRVSGLGVGLGLETTGRFSQMGSLGDIAVLAAEYPFVRPTIDWAHVHAISGGGLDSVEAFEAVLAFLRENFAPWKIDPLHTQFSDVLYDEAGEIRHIPYGQGDLRAAPLVEAALRVGFRMTVISESRDAASHRRIGTEIMSALESAADPDPPGRPAASGAVSFPTVPRAVENEQGCALVGYDHPLRLSNLDKPFFPDGYTKGDLISYYASISPVLLPHLEDRAIVMARYPDGVEASSFYEKQAPGHQPVWMPLAPIDSAHRGGVIEYVTADRPESLMWLANMGCVEIHPWLSRIQSLHAEDCAVFDLDPASGASWDQVVAVAGLLKEALDHLGLKGYPKTSGSKGIHVYVPLEPGHDYARVRTFVHSLGQVLATANPGNVTMEGHIPSRAGKVYIDSRQNRAGATIASAYSVRPRPGAPVSTPLRWGEVASIDPMSFTIATIWDRISRYGDLFAPVLLGGQTLDQAEESLGIEPG